MSCFLVPADVEQSRAVSHSRGRCALKHSTLCLPVSSLPPSTTLPHTVASQSLVMSPGGVANDSSVTLTLADAQGMLDGVTLNLNTQVTTNRAKSRGSSSNPFFCVIVHVLFLRLRPFLPCWATLVCQDRRARASRSSWSVTTPSPTAERLIMRSA